MEVYYALLRDGGPRQQAREVVASFEPVLVDFSLSEILGANLTAALGGFEQAR